MLWHQTLNVAWKTLNVTDFFVWFAMLPDNLVGFFFVRSPKLQFSTTFYRMRSSDIQKTHADSKNVVERIREISALHHFCIPISKQKQWNLLSFYQDILIDPKFIFLTSCSPVLVNGSMEDFIMAILAFRLLRRHDSLNFD